MNSQQLIDSLDYTDNPAFLRGKQLREHHGYSFIFAQAEKEDHCNLKGVYALLDSPDKLPDSSLTPVVYVCEAENEADARKIHKRVWNQNIVPFLIVVTPKNIRLYSGFEYDRAQSDEERVLEVAKNANEVLSKFSAFKSESIDSGDIWNKQKISTDKRVDRHLLDNLKKLADVLRGNSYKLPTEHAHALIGKYIYLRYLRDRGILSNERFEKAKINVNADDIFGSNANKNKLYQLEEYLNEFLNGSVFPLPSINNIRAEHIKKVARVFKGDDPESDQQVLFDMYDFSCIPIETLSVVYQQFLHAKNQGRKKGAYYTPVHLVNFMLDELEAKKPLKQGMMVFDSSCGSGAFLVQCYRRLVEGIIRDKEAKLNPTDLRKLLVDNIFGLDADEEACRVAELSLSLTLLDYINPPDLTKTNFKLPDLHDKNVFHCEGGFFDSESLWAKSMPEQGFDWIVGNPPWKNIDKRTDTEPYHHKAIEWMDANKKQCPVDNYQLAEAFAWKVTELLKKDGQCALLMPALTLFKKQGGRFRARFFSEVQTWCVVNFANLRHCLFEGADNPAATFFYSSKKHCDENDCYITTYAPFAVEQASQLNQKSKAKKKKVWSVFVNYSTIKEIPLRDVRNGSSVSWKAAMWGTHRDTVLFDYLTRKELPVLEQTIVSNNLALSEGLQLRIDASRENSKKKVNETKEIELCNEVRGEKLLSMTMLKGFSGIHSFPSNAFKRVPESRDIYVRKGRKELPLSICHPPHIILDESRRFAVYSDDFVIVPPRQIGISSNSKNQEILLKALAIYLKSNVAYYLQFWRAVNIGIERDVFNLDALKKLPVPLCSLSHDKLAEWAKLHDNIVETEKRERQARDEDHVNGQTLWSNRAKTVSKSDGSRPKLANLLKRMNDKVYSLLRISKKQQWLIEDMLNVRMKLNDGVFNAEEAIRPATRKEMDDFTRIFADELDLFLDRSGKRKVHKIKVLYAEDSAVIIVDHLMRSATVKPEVVEVADERIRQELTDLQSRLTETKTGSQWMYFRRCLRIYEKRVRRTYIFKPRQRLYWLKSQALAEADEFIAEKLATE